MTCTHKAGGGNGIAVRVNLKLVQRLGGKGLGGGRPLWILADGRMDVHD